ncbi:MAG: hypothetical protein WCA35_15445 [Kovacikia sp.]
MNTRTGNKTNVKPTEAPINGQISGFDFDSWAIQVRQQMIAALNRRGAA